MASMSAKVLRNTPLREPSRKGFSQSNKFLDARRRREQADVDRAHVERRHFRARRLRRFEPLIERHTRETGVHMAVATDCNPGSSPCTSILLALNMACTLFGLTPEEAISGVTRQAARALGILNEVGTLEVGKRADIVFWRIDRPAELCYGLGANPCVDVLYRGKLRSIQAPSKLVNTATTRA